MPDVVENHVTVPIQQLIRIVPCFFFTVLYESHTLHVYKLTKIKLECTIKMGNHFYQLILITLYIHLCCYINKQ